jgi:predicted CXXCH cytochrome family protein
MVNLLLAVALLLSLLLPARVAATDLRSGPSPAADGDGDCRLRWAMRSSSDGSSCLACHAAAQQWHGGGRHTVGALYAEARQRGALRLRSEEELPAALVLRAGRLTCITCHDPWSRARRKLAGARPADLCTGCHAM